jgi:rfaE bifunctional protein kinase chain/domain
VILVVGDAMLDEYWFGTVTRVSPEAPVPVLEMGRIECRWGGAANVAKNVAAMGGEVKSLFSPSFLLEPVRKIRLVARTNQIARADWDRPQERIPLDEVGRMARGCAVALVSDYAKGSITDPLAVIGICKHAGAVVVVDPKHRDPATYAGADVLKPNHYEMEAFVGRWTSESDLNERALALIREHGFGSIIMTRGELGMTLFSECGAISIPGAKVELCDVSGAGDTAMAAIGVALAEGKDVFDAMNCANSAAGVAVTRFGTSVVKRSEVEGFA